MSLTAAKMGANKGSLRAKHLAAELKVVPVVVKIKKALKKVVKKT